MANTREEGPLAEAVAEGGGVLIQVLITGAPTEVRVPGQSSGNRWSVTATLVEVTSKGSVIRGSADLMVMGGNGWQGVRPGQRVRTSGTLKGVREGQTQAALLSASSAPVHVASTLDLRQSSADVRSTSSQLRIGCRPTRPADAGHGHRRHQRASGKSGGGYEDNRNDAPDRGQRCQLQLGTGRLHSVSAMPEVDTPRSRGFLLHAVWWLLL